MHRYHHLAILLEGLLEPLHQPHGFVVEGVRFMLLLLRGLHWLLRATRADFLWGRSPGRRRRVHIAGAGYQLELKFSPRSG